MTPLTRREFIGTTAASTAGITLAPNMVDVFGNPAQTALFEQLPAIPYGAVYFRKSAPPREDWDRDYAQAAKDGMNAFRHWFMWSAIEVAPGVYDWDDYDRQLELADKYGISTIIAEIFGTAPEWAFLEYPHARLENASGNKEASRYTGACSVGGAPGLCLDNEDVLERGEAFFRALVERYKDHPGMGGYDIWNELNMNGGAGGCWCDASAEKFRGWLKKKYNGDLDKLADAWKRFSYRDWEDVQIPRHSGFYGDNIDWILFRQENAYRLMKWRVDLIKSIDQNHPVTAHGIVYGTIRRLGRGTYNVWKAVDLVDGSPTPRSEMAGQVAKWANDPAQKELWKARPVKGELGIIVVPESQIQDYLLVGSTEFYYKAISGAYQAFLFNNIQADFVYSEEIDDRYDVLYLPYPIMLPEYVAGHLKALVRRGGTLISESCPGYFNEHGRAGESQPNLGLAKLFGAEETYVQFTPRLLEEMKFKAEGKEISGGLNLQAYKATTGEVAGIYADGQPAVIDNRFGQGRTRLIGTSPGYGYVQSDYRDADHAFFGSLLQWAGKERHVACSDPRLVARLHEGDGYKVLWIVNSEREPVNAEFTLAEKWGAFNNLEEVVNRGAVSASDRTLKATLPARDVTVLRFF